MSKASPESSFATKADVHAVRDDLRTEMHGVRDTLLDAMHGLGAQLESMRPIFRATGERESTIEDSLKRRIADGEKKADDRLKDVEAVAKRHSGALAQHGSALASLRTELEGLREAYHMPNSAEVAAFEARLARLEEAVGIARR